MDIRSKIRIYADFNGLVDGIVNPKRTAVVLDTYGSLRDLSNAGIVLSIGLPLVVFDASDESEDLEGHGTAQYDASRKWWVVEFDEKGVRYVSARDRDIAVDSPFHCVKCAEPIAGATWNTIGIPGLCCKSCGTSVLAALAPPPLVT
ncbi:hypothetical protein [Lysobacter brunescens]|uniref:Uncharacterized protein n=1 Tax=Lysobacter brunescens TaxID=262323 RepID=A0ABW2YFK9_9GAMM